MFRIDNNGKIIYGINILERYKSILSQFPKHKIYNIFPTGGLYKYHNILNWELQY